MPVLPAVPSTIMPPGRSFPLRSASRMMNKAALSFTDWPGFMNSALPKISQPVSSETRSSLIRGVLPIASMMPWWMVTGFSCKGIGATALSGEIESAMVQTDALGGQHASPLGDQFSVGFSDWADAAVEVEEPSRAVAAHYELAERYLERVSRCDEENP